MFKHRKLFTKEFNRLSQQGYKFHVLDEDCTSTEVTSAKEAIDEIDAYEHVELVITSPRNKKSFISFVSEWDNSVDDVVTTVCDYNTTDFVEYLNSDFE